MSSSDGAKPVKISLELALSPSLLLIEVIYCELKIQPRPSSPNPGSFHLLTELVGKMFLFMRRFLSFLVLV